MQRYSELTVRERLSKVIVAGVLASSMAFAPAMAFAAPTDTGSTDDPEIVALLGFEDTLKDSQLMRDDLSAYLSNTILHYLNTVVQLADQHLVDIMNDPDAAGDMTEYQTMHELCNEFLDGNGSKTYYDYMVISAKMAALNAGDSIDNWQQHANAMAADEGFNSWDEYVVARANADGASVTGMTIDDLKTKSVSTILTEHVNEAYSEFSDAEVAGEYVDVLKDNVVNVFLLKFMDEIDQDNPEAIEHYSEIVGDGDDFELFKYYGYPEFETQWSAMRDVIVQAVEDGTIGTDATRSRIDEYASDLFSFFKTQNVLPELSVIFNVVYEGTPWVGESTGSGATDLTMLSASGEYGGTSEPSVIPAPDGTDPDDRRDENGNPDPDGEYIDNPAYNPDRGDGLGENLQFTVPASINYVLKASGELIGPNNAFVENRSAIPIHTSSLKVTAMDGWNIVEDSTATSENDSVDVQIGPSIHAMQNAADFLGEKKAVSGGSAWNMTATDSTVGSGDDALTMITKGHAEHVTKDISSRQKFGELRWYMSTGNLEKSIEFNEQTGSNALYDYDAVHGMPGSDDNRDELVSRALANGYEDDELEFEDEDGNWGGYPMAINGKLLAVTAPVLNAQMGDWFTLHMSDGSTIDIICVNKMQEVNGYELGVDGIYKADDSNALPCAVGFFGEFFIGTEASTISDFTLVGHPDVHIVSAVNHGQAPEIA